MYVWLYWFIFIFSLEVHIWITERSKANKKQKNWNKRNNILNRNPDSKNTKPFTWFLDTLLKTLYFTMLLTVENACFVFRLLWNEIADFQQSGS